MRALGVLLLLAACGSPGTSKKPVVVPSPRGTVAPSDNAAVHQTEASLELGETPRQADANLHQQYLGARYSFPWAERLHLVSNDLAAVLSDATFRTVQMKFDFASRQGWLEFGAGTEGTMRVGLMNEVIMRGDVARVSSELQLSLRGDTLQLRLPTFEVKPNGLYGPELHVPLLHGQF